MFSWYNFNKLIFAKKTPFKGVFNQQLLTKIITEILRENYVCVLIYYFNTYFFVTNQCG